MSFKDIDDTMDEYSIGWVSVADMFDAGFAYSSYARRGLHRLDDAG
jgi:hypothetical protein